MSNSETTAEGRHWDYAFGCIVYEALTGEFAIPGDDPVSMKVAHQSGMAEESAAKLVVPVRDFALKCLALKPEHRHSDWGSVVTDLQTLLAGTETPSDFRDGAARSPSMQAAALVGLGHAHCDTGGTSDAKELFRRAIAIAVSENDIALEGHAELALSGALRMEMDFKGALVCAERARDVAEVLDDVRGRSCAHHSIGCAQLGLGDLQGAIENLELDASLSSEHDQRGIQVTLCDLAIAYRTAGRQREALLAFERAAAAANTQGDPTTLRRVWIGAGNIFYDSSAYHQAMPCYERALAMSREQCDVRGECLALGNIGNTWVGLGNRAAGMRELGAALQVAKDAGEPRLALRPLARLARLHAEQLEWNRAMALSELRVELAAKLDDWCEHFDALNDQGIFYLELGKAEQAAALFERSESSRRTLRTQRGWRQP